MLHLYFDSLRNLAEREDFIRYPAGEFDMGREPEWLDDPFSRRVIEAINHIPLDPSMPTEYAICLQGISARKLCTGVKALILCKFENLLNRMTALGENCYPYLMELADTKDVYMGCSSYVYLSEELLQGRTVHIVNNDRYVSNYQDYMECLAEVTKDNLFDW